MQSGKEKPISYRETKRKSSFGGSSIKNNDGSSVTTNLDYSDTKRKHDDGKTVEL